MKLLAKTSIGVYHFAFTRNYVGNLCMVQTMFYVTLPAKKNRFFVTLKRNVSCFDLCHDAVLIHRVVIKLELIASPKENFI